MSKLELDRLLRKPRSKEYMEAMRKLDIGSHVLGDAQRDEIIRILQEEFPEVKLGGILEGIIAKCYIGPEYDVCLPNLPRRELWLPGEHTSSLKSTMTAAGV